MKKVRNTWYTFLADSSRMTTKQLIEVFLWVVANINGVHYKKEKMLSQICRKDALVPFRIPFNRFVLAYKKSCRLGNSAGSLDISWIEKYVIKREHCDVVYELVFWGILKKQSLPEVNEFSLLPLEQKVEIVYKFLAKVPLIIGIKERRYYDFCLKLSMLFHAKFFIFYDIMANYHPMEASFSLSSVDDEYVVTARKIAFRAISNGYTRLAEDLHMFFFPKDKKFTKIITKIKQSKEKYAIPVLYNNQK